MTRKRVGTFLGGGTLVTARDKSWFAPDQPKAKPKTKPKKKFRLGFDKEKYLAKVRKKAASQKPKPE
ncbi:hypothetical protein [Bradyrhizobium elkanii]|uniref:hypothetical protein n=1 Tax=Bradyrhizobium elkanii TaxID=29448 RepID=UPI0012BCA278|nr:hypothetical protein [Bradyrhizobium elkanii]